MPTAQRGRHWSHRTLGGRGPSERTRIPLELPATKCQTWRDVNQRTGWEVPRNGGSKGTRGPSAIEEAERQFLRQLLSGLPARYEERYEALLRLRRIFHEEAGLALQTELRAHAREQPQDTHADRESLIRVLSEDLQRLGLTLECPQTGSRATLASLADDPRNRYQFLVRLPGGRESPSIATPDLPDLHLVPAEGPSTGLRLFRWRSSKGPDAPSR
jgi:hypothetical protein